MPASNDPEADRACFLAIMTMGDNGLRQRFKGITPKKRVLELATPAERAAYQDLEETWQNAPSPEEKRTRKAELNEAVKTACDHLVPPGIDRSVWRGLTAAERFYLKGLDLESRGEHRAGAYQELARGFGLKDYSPLLASGRVNKVRLDTPTSLDKKHLRGEPGDFATSLLRHTLFAIYEISRQADAGAGTEPGRQWLQKEVPTYWADRKTIIALLRYLARFEQTLETWQHDAPAARLLAGTLENDHEG